MGESSAWLPRLAVGGMAGSYGGRDSATYLADFTSKNDGLLMDLRNFIRRFHIMFNRQDRNLTNQNGSLN